MLLLFLHTPASLLILWPTIHKALPWSGPGFWISFSSRFFLPSFGCWNSTQFVRIQPQASKHPPFTFIKKQGIPVIEQTLNIPFNSPTSPHPLPKNFTLGVESTKLLHIQSTLRIKGTSYLRKCFLQWTQEVRIKTLNQGFCFKVTFRFYTELRKHVSWHALCWLHPNVDVHSIVKRHHLNIRWPDAYHGSCVV